MRADAVWNLGGFYEAPRFSNVNKVKIDIAKCEIVINIFGFIYLYMSGKRLKPLTFKQYLLYKDYVLDVIREDG